VYQGTYFTITVYTVVDFQLFMQIYYIQQWTIRKCWNLFARKPVLPISPTWPGLLATGCRKSIWSSSRISMTKSWSFSEHFLIFRYVSCKFFQRPRTRQVVVFDWRTRGRYSLPERHFPTGHLCAEWNINGPTDEQAVRTPLSGIAGCWHACMI